MAEHPNVARVRAAYAAFDKSDLNGALADLAVDAVFHFTGEGPNSGDHKGRDERPQQRPVFLENVPHHHHRTPSRAAGASVVKIDRRLMGFVSS